MERRKKRLRTKTILFSSAVLLLIVFVFSWISLTYITDDFEDKAYHNLSDTAGLVLQTTDLHIKDMRRATIATMINMQVMDLLDALYGKTPEEVPLSEYYKYADDLNRLLFSFLASDDALYRINIFNENGIFFSSDNGINITNVPFAGTMREEIARKASDREGRVYISSGYRDELRSAISPEGTRLFSVARMYRLEKRTYGYVEVQKRYDIIEEMVKQNQVEGRYFLILNSNDEVFYPYHLEENTVEQEMWSYYGEHGKEKTQSIYEKVKFDGSDYRVITTYSDYSGLTLVCCENERSMMGALYDVAATIIFLLAAIFLFGILGTVLMLNHIYKPLGALQKKADEIEYLPDSHRWEMPETYDFSLADAEIGVLNRSLDNMIGRLNQSIEESLQLQSKMERAYYKSLQSQVNPHFMSNALSMIAILTETGDNRVPSICLHLSQLLRYSSSLERTTVSLAEEWTNLENYLSILKTMYEQRLTSHVMVDSRLLNLQVPRMFLQPLVENSIKHGFVNLPDTLHISVRGTDLRDFWELVVQDNGSGIDPETLRQIRQELAACDEDISKVYAERQNQLSKIGILNTYARLKIIYGETLYFEMQGENGCTILMRGGYLSDE